MYNAVKSFCNANETVWNNIPAFVLVFALFNTKLAELNQFAETQYRSLLGVKAVKDLERQRTAALAHKIASALRVFAKETGNTSLLAHLDFRESGLYQGSSTKTIHYLNRVKDVAQQYALVLTTDFAISQEQIDELVQRIDQMQAIFGSTRDAVIIRGIATEQIKEMVAEISDLLKRELDLLVEFIKNDHHDFAVGYKLAREIVDIHGKKQKPRIDDVPPAV